MLSIADLSRRATQLGLLLVPLSALVSLGCGRATRASSNESSNAGATSAAGVASNGGMTSNGGVTSIAGTTSSAGAGGVRSGSAEQAVLLQQLFDVVCTSVDCSVGLDFEEQRVRRGVAAGRLAIDAAALARCLAGDTVNSSVFDSRTTRACSEIWVPLTPLGDECDTDYACIGGFCQRSDFGRSRPHYAAGGCGVCVARGSLGEPCHSHGWTGADAECEPGLSCGCADGTAGCEAGVCLVPTPGALGEPCPKGECEAGLVCQFAGGSLGTCQAPQPAGSSCTADEQCADVCEKSSGAGRCGYRQRGESCAESSDCALGNYCEAGVCRASTLGLPCLARGMDEGCADGSTCATRGSDEVCLAQRQLGETCDSSRQCPKQSTCRGGLCLQLLAVGTACDPDAARSRCAEATHCRDGTCQPLPHSGEKCSDTCLVGSCSEGLCALLEPGAACSGEYNVGDPCGAGLECDADLCTPRPALGEPCDDSTCDTGAYCSSADRCQPICLLDERKAPR